MKAAARADLAGVKASCRIEQTRSAFGGQVWGESGGSMGQHNQTSDSSSVLERAPLRSLL
jgi:hypothetical protein